LNLANAQTPRVEAHNAVVKAVKVPLMLGYEQGLEISIAVPRDLNWQHAVIAAQRLFAVAVAGIGLLLGRAFVFVVAQVGRQLGLENPVGCVIGRFSTTAAASPRKRGWCILFLDMGKFAGIAPDFLGQHAMKAVIDPTLHRARK
jgi:hypothetical protein